MKGKGQSGATESCVRDKRELERLLEEQEEPDTINMLILSLTFSEDPSHTTAVYQVNLTQAAAHTIHNHCKHILNPTYSPTSAVLHFVSLPRHLLVI